MSDYYFFIYIKDKNNVTAVFPKRVSAVVLQCGRVGEKKGKQAYGIRRGRKRWVEMLGSKEIGKPLLMKKELV